MSQEKPNGDYRTVINTGDAPTYAHDGDAGADIRASEDLTIGPGQRALVRTGLRIACPDGLVAMICSRSGLAAKNGVFVANAPGIVDSGYRGEVMVNLYNGGHSTFTVTKGMRIAQIVFVPFVTGWFLPVDEESFDEVAMTERGDKGHGSSGVQ